MYCVLGVEIVRTARNVQIAVIAKDAHHACVAYTALGAPNTNAKCIL